MQSQEAFNPHVPGILTSRYAERLLGHVENIKINAHVMVDLEWSEAIEAAFAGMRRIEGELERCGTMIEARSDARWENLLARRQRVLVECRQVLRAAAERRRKAKR